MSKSTWSLGSFSTQQESLLGTEYGSPYAAPPWARTSIIDDTAQSTRRRWTRKGQFWRLLISMGWRWLTNFTFCGLLAVLLWSYSTSHINLEDSETLSRGQKHTYNALSIGLVLFTGLHLDAAFQHMAGVFKWYLLSIRKYTAKQFIRVLNCDCQHEVLLLMKENFRDKKIVAVSMSWLFYRLSVQITLALLGLAASLATPLEVGSLAIRRTTGTGSVVQFNPIQVIPDAVVTNDTQVSDANTYGIQGQGMWDFGPDDSNNPAGWPFMMNNTDGSFDSWRYYLKDQSLDAKTLYLGDGQITSPRYISSNATCMTANILDRTIDGPSWFNVSYSLGDADTFILQIPSSTVDTSYFQYDYVFEDPGINGDMRAVIVYAYRSALAEDGTEQTALFLCTNSVSRIYLKNTDPNVQVNNLLIDEPNIDPNLFLPDLQARMLAGAIGDKAYEDEEFWSFSIDTTEDDLAQMVSLFPILAIQAMDLYGPRVNATNIPIASTGSILLVKWGYVGAILGVIPLSHFLLIVFVLFKTRNVIVRDNGPLSTTLFLKDMVWHIKSGKMLSDADAASMIPSDMLYSWEEVEEKMGTTKRLSASNKRRPYETGPRKARAFTAGYYD